MRFFKENIPEEMRNLNQWVAFRAIKKEGHMGKIMVNPQTGEYAKTNDSSTWTSFDNALKYSRLNKMDGIAFVLTEGITFVDLDECISKDGTISSHAQEVLDMMPNTYAERSVSGRGIHIFSKGKLPDGCLKRNDKLGIEMYDTKRFACMTGSLLPDRKIELLDMQKEIEAVNNHFMPRKVFSPKIYKVPLTLKNDEEVLKILFNSKNGWKYRSLYQGDISSYPSHSNADLALTSGLAYFTQDRIQIDRIFRSSGLFREKWDSKRGDSTYGEITINTALNTINRNPLEAYR